MSEISAQFPAKMQCLFQPKRFKTFWGGRGAGRSWGFARALLLRAVREPIRILCARELQNSISESVHKLLSDQIFALGLDSEYVIEKGKIYSKCGGEFFFDGIRNNVTKIKSYEGIDICWVEEADKVSRSSWGILIPTVRKLGSEIWMTFNPSLETDYTYQRFVLEPSDDAFVVKMTYKDNPWFPEVLRAEMEDLRERDYDAYLNVWEGFPLQMLEGTVYAKELRRVQEEGRITSVPWDRETPVETFWDLGRADRTTIWFAQKVAMQYRFLEYYEASQEDIHHYIQHCQSRPYTYGQFHLPHDARAKVLGSKRSIEEIIRASGRSVHVVPKLSVVDGINAARIIFPNCWFDEVKCADGLDRLRHYRYKVIDGQLSNEPLHDEASDGADSFRYAGVSLRGPKQRNDLSAKLRRAANAFADEIPGMGWMS